MKFSHDWFSRCWWILTFHSSVRVATLPTPEVSGRNSREPGGLQENDECKKLAECVEVYEGPTKWVWIHLHLNYHWMNINPKIIGKYMNECENYEIYFAFFLHLFLRLLAKGKGKSFRFAHTVEIWLFQIFPVFRWRCKIIRKSTNILEIKSKTSNIWDLYCRRNWNFDHKKLQCVYFSEHRKI